MSADEDIESRLRSLIVEISGALDDLGVRWTLAGAFAADEYRRAHRPTTDADLLVEWNERLPPMLEAAGFELKVLIDDGDVHLIRARRGDDAVDLIVAGTDYQLLAIERGLQRGLSIEDVLVHKVIAWRPKDRDDIAAILAKGDPFDRDYLERWVRAWDVEDRWREAQSWAN